MKISELFEEKKVKQFECIGDGLIEVVVGEAHSAEAKKGNKFIVDSNFRNGEDNLRYYGTLIIDKNFRFIHTPGLSGNVIKNPYDLGKNKIEYAIMKENVTNKSDNFWATWKEIK
jgi:hypothetical protein